MPYLTAHRLNELLARAPAVRVLVVGDIMLDRYLRGAASRISPEAPVPVVRITEEWRALGGAANVAANVVALGAGCTLAGCIGEDAEGRLVRAALHEKGINDSAVIEDASRPTTVKTRIMARHHQVARFDREAEDNVDNGCAAQLGTRIQQALQHCQAMVLEDYNKGVLVQPVVRAAIRAATEAGVPVVVDPKSRNFFDYAGATVFKPNRTELEAALRGVAHPDDAGWMEQTRQQLSCAHLLLTLGEDGMSLMTEAGVFVRVPTTARAVFDVSGAGDTVTAAVAVALAAGATPAEAAILANHAAGIEVGKVGVAAVTPAELLGHVRETPAE